VSQCKELAYEFGMYINLKLSVSWVKHRTAGKDWFLGFTKRHIEISLRKPEGLSMNRAQAFNRDRIEKYFDSIKKIIGDIKIPNFLFNMDETGLSDFFFLQRRYDPAEEPLAQTHDKALIVLRRTLGLPLV
jgi:hypothetical protein